MGDEAFDELFGAPVGEFVARRDELVKQLRAAGDRELATEVKAWRRPSRVVAALNRLALRQPEAAAAVVEAAEAVGSVGRAGLREATARYRAVVRDAARAAVDALDDARPSDLGEVTSALLTLGSDEEALATFRTGRLLTLEDAGAGGFGIDLGAAPAPPAEPDASAVDDARAALDRAGAAARRAQDAEEAAAERVAAARRQLEEAERAHAEAEGTTAAAQADHDEARRALAEAEAEAQTG